MLKRPRGCTNKSPQKYSSVGEAKVSDSRDIYRMYDGAPDTRVDHVMYVLGCGQKVTFYWYRPTRIGVPARQR